MKILWIVNSVLKAMSVHLFGRSSNGLWMDALLEKFQDSKEFKLVVVTTAAVKHTVCITESNITYYALPDQPPLLYNENKKKNILEWQELLNREHPNLIQVWGTEFTHGLCALRLAKGIPAVIYMQGLLGTIAKYYLAGISYEELKKNVTIRDIIKQDSILQQQKKYYRASVKEAEMLRIAGRIISENTWCDSNIKAIVPDIKNYSCPLSINGVFRNYDWSLNHIERHTIICTASGYPLKGLHMVFRAVSLLKNKYPDIKVYVPGPSQVSPGSLQWKLRKRGYTKYIERLIEKLDIDQNIVWLGQLPQEKLAECYSRSHVFVMSSSIENHSSSLKEAMIVGLPCISSAVGGIPEYVDHAKNGFLYRFEEYEMLIHFIDLLFEDDFLAASISLAEKEEMRHMHDSDVVYQNIRRIYCEIISEKN